MRPSCIVATIPPGIAYEESVISVEDGYDHQIIGRVELLAAGASAAVGFNGWIVRRDSRYLFDPLREIVPDEPTEHPTKSPERDDESQHEPGSEVE